MIEVSTWSGFLAAVSTSGETVELTADITADSELTETLYFKCSNLNGKNHKIIGIKGKNNGYLQFNSNLTITGVDFVNMYFDVSQAYCLFNAYGYNTEITNCRFNGVIKTDFIKNAGTAKNLKFKKCSFALRGYDVSISATNKTASNETYELCDFMLYGTWTPMRLADFTSSRIKGGVVTFSTSTTASTLTDSVIDATVTGDINVSATGSIINTDKATGTITGGLMGVTAVQMNDFNYLNSIGFEVYEDVGNS